MVFLTCILEVNFVETESMIEKQRMIKDEEELKEQIRTREVREDDEEEKEEEKKRRQEEKKQRIEAFLHPDDPSYTGNYQVIQSMIAIGSGGLTGKGLYNGTQNQEGFLPVQESDFIFAVIGEELGVWGMAIIMILYAFFLIRMLTIAREAKDFYGTLIVVGVMCMFAYQIIQNIGMTVAVIPVTGVTLPFVSYGGSSLMTSLANLGLVLNVGMRRKKINF